MSKISQLSIMVFLLLGTMVFSQDYYYQKFKPFNKNIPSPEEFFGYSIGDAYTRHDLVVAYMEKLASLSDKATIQFYGKTNEGRKLVMLIISSVDNHKNLDVLKEKHLLIVDENTNVTEYSELPIFINLGYNVHGNEPSGTEAALLAAYTLVASESLLVEKYLDESVIFIEPTINPDGRDRYANWANSYKGNPLIADKYDIAHNEQWPYGRTNHYWFDLNRDLLLAVQPESNARLEWFHEWYPNVVTDFHEMGTNSTYFFEPKQHSASLNPVTPIENNVVLNTAFAKDYVADLDEINSLYFTKEKYDATYPGYGSTYGDLQGSLALLFEQGGSRGHVQETETGTMTFAFTIRNQYVSTFATIKAAIKNKELLYAYQNNFFKNAINQAAKSKVKGYVFGDNYDKNRNKEFVDLLLKHKIDVYSTDEDLNLGNKTFKKGRSFVVPTEQKEYLMVRTMFETHRKYRDSVFYDASSWSMANFYNMKYEPLSKLPVLNSKITLESNIIKTPELAFSEYAYLIPWDDYYAPALLYKLQEQNVVVKTAQEPFIITTDKNVISFNRGTLLVPVSLQSMTNHDLFELLNGLCKAYGIQAYSTNSGYSISGIDLGSSNFATLKQPKTMMLVGSGVSAYEAGEVWHLFEQRMQMPITKVANDMFGRVDLERYNVMVFVSGSYNSLSKISYDRIKDWVAKGNTLITIRTASAWAIKNKIVNERFIDVVKDSIVPRLNYADARGTIGKQKIGGTIFNVDLDITHPIAYGYYDRNIPIYKNNDVFIAPSKNSFATVAKYTEQPHIDGFVSQENIDNYIVKSASILTSKIGSGRVILFSDNPNFRGAWYGTNKLFLNSIFFGSIIK
ncbi:zinc carboxypeptidase [Pseudalgibacter alginicilyticus]|uniref:Zinc carboxypeptidase n=1 Tax=Pseudalgibacter alginicilyticus TaxID=1736674 RepID=A0A0P0CZV1_9FLAO|nr:M14 family zinc carboxypeptidase [Pseudalgibacter alginicilyticus]ALJ03804.1 zinc carboxypeptidase [Pseudalgibacter alginicilyticus]